MNKGARLSGLSILEWQRAGACLGVNRQLGAQLSRASGAHDTSCQWVSVVILNGLKMLPNFRIFLLPDVV